MAKKLDKILVIDLESTCWEGSPPEGQTSDIIEIGLCILDVESLEREEKRSLLVRPERSELSPFCTQLTTLTPELIAREGTTLREAIKILKKDYRSKDRLWASWGDYDRRQFERVCKALEIGYPFGTTHLNVKNLFATALGHNHELGLDGAFKKLGMTLEGTHHRGHDDAWNIALVLSRLLKHQREAMRA